jgi:hypothetical protein
LFELDAQGVTGFAQSAVSYFPDQFAFLVADAHHAKEGYRVFDAQTRTGRGNIVDIRRQLLVAVVLIFPGDFHGLRAECPKSSPSIQHKGSRVLIGKQA